MPISEYYGGHGNEVMGNMQREYGSKEGKRVFYATANKRGQGRGKKKSKKRGHRRRARQR